MADGPATFGTPVRSNRPGSTSSSWRRRSSAAPIDFNAVGRWIERVPTLTLDGVPADRARPGGPSARLLAARSDRPLRRACPGRRSAAGVGAFVRTPLGDRQPYAGGYWLKTLTGLDRLRVWWAETDAAEEYEDALLGAFAAAVPARDRRRLHDPDVDAARSPTSSAPTGSASVTAWPGALLTDDASQPATDADRRAAGGEGQDGRQRRAGSFARGRRSRLESGSRTTPARAKPTTRSDIPTRVGRASRSAGPMTGARPNGRRPGCRRSGLAALQAELEELTTVTRPAIVARIVAARELGDLKENSDYHEARREQSFAEGRIQAIEDLLRNVELIDDGDPRRSGAARLDGRRRRTARRRGDVHPGRVERGEPRLPVGSRPARRSAPRCSTRWPATRSRRSSRRAACGSRSWPSGEARAEGRTAGSRARRARPGVARRGAVGRGSLLVVRAESGPRRSRTRSRSSPPASSSRRRTVSAPANKPFKIAFESQTADAHNLAIAVSGAASDLPLRGLHRSCARGSSTSRRSPLAPTLPVRRPSGDGGDPDRPVATPRGPTGRAASDQLGAARSRRGKTTSDRDDCRRRTRRAERASPPTVIVPFRAPFGSR